MANPNAPSRFEPAPMNPDEFSTGRPDKFIGTILGTYAYPYKGRNSTDGKYYLTVGWVIQPDEDTGYSLFCEPYSGGFLNQAFPSKDNKTPAGASFDEYLVLSNGAYTVPDPLEKPVLDERGIPIPDSPFVGEYVLGQLSKGRSWEQAAIALRDSDTKSQVDFSKPGYLGFANGFRCRFDRVPQSGGAKSNANKKDGDKEYKVLVPTEIVGVGKGASASTGKAAGAADPSKANGSANGDLASAATAEILNYLKANGGKAAKGTLISEVSKVLKKQGYNKADAMAWIGDVKSDKPQIPVNLVDIDGTSFDTETQTLELD